MQIREVHLHRRSILEKAIQSGEFKKTAGNLRRIKNNSARYDFCGVMCELYRRMTGKGHWIENPKPDTRGRGQLFYFVLPDSKRVWTWDVPPLVARFYGLSDESEDRMAIAARNDQGLTLQQSFERAMKNNGRRGTGQPNKQ